MPTTNDAIDGTVAGTIAVADPVKPPTAEAIRDLHAEALRIVMLTGEHAEHGSGGRCKPSDR